MTIHTHNLTFNARAPRRTTVVHALALYRTWSPEYPPLDLTGDRDSDLVLAAVFKRLIETRNDDQAFGVIECQLFQLNDRPGEYAIEPWRPVLHTWWLDLYAALK